MRTIQPHAWAIPLLAFGLLISQPSPALCCTGPNSVDPESAKLACCRPEVAVRAVETSRPSPHQCCCREQRPNSPLIQSGTRAKLERTPTLPLITPALAALATSQSSAILFSAGMLEPSGPPIFLRLARFRN